LRFNCHSPTHRHVAKTGDIKDFVITEESGIAKGIRRITAVTGHEAHEATRVAAALGTKLSRAEQMIGSSKEAVLKALSVVRVIFKALRHLRNMFHQQELSQADISVIVKSDLTTKLQTIRKAFDKQTKANEAAANKKVTPDSPHV
jgi:alanyl-tRNA synthetase